MKLVPTSVARAVDERARIVFGLSDHALVEAAAASCTFSLVSAFPGLSDFGRVVILAGKGNNAADALAVARQLVIKKRLDIRSTSVILKDVLPTIQTGQQATPFGSNLHALQSMGASIHTWNAKDGALQALLSQADFIMDGLAGTGLEGELRGSAREMAEAVNKVKALADGPIVIAVDLPSGLGDFWLPGMCLLDSNITLAVEPRKTCLYLPAARLRCGRILACEEVFPPGMDLPLNSPVLTDFRQAAASIPPVRADSYKQNRGVVEIRAGSVGTSGAAKLAARGACAAGAGLIKLRVDKELWPVLANSEYGAIVRIDDGSSGTETGTDVCLAGPGWGRDPARVRILESLIAQEAQGLLLVLDADALRMIGGRVFSGNTILTPHPLEFSDLIGIPKDRVLENPDPYLHLAAKEKNVVIILKGHVTRIAAPDGRLCYIDGLCPVLATGGTGDVLAGLVAGLVARAKKTADCNGETSKAGFDPFPSAVAAAALLVEAGKAAQEDAGFCDAADFARMAGRIAGAAWLSKESC